MRMQRCYGDSSDRSISPSFVQPHKSIASSSSCRRISRTLVAPCSPPMHRPHKIGLPIRTALAPGAIALTTSLRRPLSVPHLSLAPPETRRVNSYHDCFFSGRFRPVYQLLGNRTVLVDIELNPARTRCLRKNRLHRCIREGTENEQGPHRLGRFC